MTEKVLVPDIGDAEEVTVVEVLVSVGDMVSAEDSVIVLESDKASMEVPSPVTGKVSAINVSEGDIVNEGDLILELDTESSPEDGESSGGDEVATPESQAPTGDSDVADPESEAESSDEVAESGAGDLEGGTKTESHTVVVPDVGGANEVIVVEVLVAAGDQVDVEDSIVVLESDKASMDIPAGMAGTIKEVLVSEGQEVEQNDSLVVMEVEAGKKASDQAGRQDQEGREDKTDQGHKKDRVAEPVEDKLETDERERSAAIAEPATDEAGESDAPGVGVAGGKIHAGPAVRKQAREYGVDLTDVKGSGRKGRILKEDVQKYVKDRLSKGTSQESQGGIPPIPAVDFSKFGEVDVEALSRVRKSSARNLHRSWLNLPHVTQFDEADITDLEEFRKSWNEGHKDEGVKITPLAFLIKICTNALIQYPHFNASLDEKVENLIVKRYYNIGIAVDTDDGLVVPVIKNVDQKGVVELAQESAELAAKARDKKLPLDSMQGATFTISSLGGIGGTGFTPIINAPEVAILGVSRAKVSPVFDGKGFSPRTMLPLSLSYDHRAIDGAEAARFTTWLANALTDVPNVLM